MEENHGKMLPYPYWAKKSAQGRDQVRKQAPVGVWVLNLFFIWAPVWNALGGLGCSLGDLLGIFPRGCFALKNKGQKNDKHTIKK